MAHMGDVRLKARSATNPKPTRIVLMLKTNQVLLFLKTNQVGVLSEPKPKVNQV